jgi:preprotein translocase subunit SecY
MGPWFRGGEEEQQTMLQKLTAALQVPDIRKRLEYVLLMFAVYVVAIHVPAAGVDQAAMAGHLGGVFNMVDIFGGGALRKFSVIAMGIMPYINASIIMQLLTIAIPKLQELQKEGESGRKQISKYTRYATIGLALVQAYGYYQLLSHPSQTGGAAVQAGFANMLTIMVTLTAGTMFLLWLGEQITEKGIGNGVSLIIFVGIMVSIPTQVSATITELSAHAIPVMGVIALMALFLATIVGIVYMTQGTRKIPVRHMRRIVGSGNNRQMTQEGTSYLPLKVNTAGVIPIIFAMSIMFFPATFAQFFRPGQSGFGDFVRSATDFLNPMVSTWASLPFAALVLFFTYFYTAIQYDTSDIADNMKKQGSFIPSIRPGKPTAEYLDRVLTRITLAGAVFLTAVALIQYWAPRMTGVNTFSLVGGTSLMIVVGVALETMQAIEAQMAMRNYEGFIRANRSAGDGAAPGRPRPGGTQRARPLDRGLAR